MKLATAHDAGCLARQTMVVLALLLAISYLQGIKFELRGKNFRCISEDLDPYMFVQGNVSIAPVGRSVKLDIKRPDGKLLSTKPKVEKEEFNFTTDAGGDYKICFQPISIKQTVNGTDQDLPTIVEFKLKVGAAGVDFIKDENKTEKEHIANNIHSMNKVSKQILQDITAIRSRESAINKKIENNGSFLRFVSIVSIVLIVAVAIAEILYLNKFFILQKVA
ncbi:MAG: hypothetical protein EZS28_001025 [Streblomastix strix]|uniref:GOLD domain-containing protein n=1 Tax=Streblomastix strix TaxID=222440 RepID=A0A5J4XAA8_9EUKA|nr:MAG: hypothetical protein EZS28_001025 [Streblomastix strix]